MKYYSSFTITPENCLSNRALAYGDGVFETMLCVNRQIPLFDLHWQRLEESLQSLKINSLSKPEIFKIIRKLIQDTKTYIVKLVVFRKDVSRGYSSNSSKNDFIISVHPYLEKALPEKLTICSTKLSIQKQTAGLKHLSRLEQVLASLELEDLDYQDGIMLDQKKRVIETINKNIIFIKGNNIYSPKLNKCGVYGVALRWLQSVGFEIIWKKIKLKNINKYHAMMVGNSIIGFNKITQINKDLEFLENHKVMDQISDKWRDTINI